MQNPLLAAMRARRAQQEAEISAPHRAAAAQANQRAAEERKAREGLEALLRSKLLPHVLDEIGHKLGDAVHNEIMKAVSAQKGFGGTTTLQLPTDMLLSADRNSVVGRVVDWWKSEVAPRMDVRAHRDGAAPVKSHHTILDIRLPQMGYRHAVMDTL